jgi:hypothetical protein
MAKYIMESTLCMGSQPCKRAGATVCKFPAPHFEFPGSGNEPRHGDLAMFAVSRRAPKAARWSGSEKILAFARREGVECDADDKSEIVRGAAARSRALNLENAISMGLKSGE